jgi:hypothetical protein
MAEKTLRQIICETIHPEYKQKIKGCYECGEAERIADSILVSISARIKAKALTDEQIENALIKYGVVEVHHITSKSQIAKYQVIMKAFQEAILEDLK